jgi:hypothetical protein
MRHISFALTTPQIRARSKTVTRRLGWRNLQPGTLLQGCVKCQGLKKGERVEKLCVIRVVAARIEPLNAITQEDVVREGFPGMSPAEFVQMFCKHNGCTPGTAITRIEFTYKEETESC